jgi:hypothetical protein
MHTREILSMLKTFHPNINRPIHTWKTFKPPHHFISISFFTSNSFSLCFFNSLFAFLSLPFSLPLYLFIFLNLFFSLFTSLFLFLLLFESIYCLYLSFYFFFYVLVQWLSYNYVYVYAHTNVYIYVYMCNIVALIDIFIKFVYTYFLCKNSVTIKRFDELVW